MLSRRCCGVCVVASMRVCMPIRTHVPEAEAAIGYDGAKSDCQLVSAGRFHESLSSGEAIG